MGKKGLLDDEWDEQPAIKVNEEYARRFEYNKRREELHRLQEKHPELAARLAAKAASGAARAARQNGAVDDEEDSEDSSSDDDEEDLDADDDTDKVLETLVRIKHKDPVLKQQDVVLFPQQPEDGEDDEGEEAAGQQAAAGRDKKSKPMYLRTVLAKQALEGVEVGSDEEEGPGDGAAVPKQPVAHSYAAEQQELKKAFLQAAAEAEEGADDGVLQKKAGKRSAAEAEDAGQDKEQQVNKLLEQYFGKDDELDPAGAFLKSYIANKAWKESTDGSSGRKKRRIKGFDGGSSSSEDEGDSGGGSEGGDDEGARGVPGVDDEEDEEFLEEVDRFEAAYNFRYEEPGSHRIQSFPRVIDDSVRRPDERRKRQRDAKAARKQAEKEAREVEVRRLKNLKKQEIQDMFARIQKEAGIKATGQSDAAEAGAKEDAAAALSKSGGLANLLDELLEGDFDPDAYDKRMAAAFDDDYYEGEDERDELFGDGMEEFAAEDDVLKPAAVATLGDESAAAGGFALLHQQLQQQQQGDDSEAEDGEGDGDKAAAAAARAQQRSQLQRKLEEYYKLDCEDNIAGIPCRFKYRQVPAETFGLSVEDILTLPDKELNQIVGMKQLAAPYRDDGKRLRPNYKALQRIKGEAAAAAAMRQQKRDRQKAKEVDRHQRRQQQSAAQQQPAADEQGKQQQQQQHGGKKRRFDHANGQQQFKQRPQHRQQRQQQQKSLADMTAEEKQAARLASYAKLTLKPQQQQQSAGQQQHGRQHKRHKAAGQQQDESKKKKKEPQAQPQGRLAAVPVDAPLTKAQKKNLLRSLKRKEKKAE